jgi:formylglycine-generating enzyme required for sulfatase activity
MHGNVWEWCRDVLAPYTLPVAKGDGARLIPPELPVDAPELAVRVVRGGAFANPPARARSSSRWSAVTSFRSNVVGVRPARAIEYKTAP